MWTAVNFWGCVCTCVLPILNECSFQFAQQWESATHTEAAGYDIYKSVFITLVQFIHKRIHYLTILWWRWRPPTSVSVHLTLLFRLRRHSVQFGVWVWCAELKHLQFQLLVFFLQLDKCLEAELTLSLMGLGDFLCCWRCRWCQSLSISLSRMQQLAKSLNLGFEARNLLSKYTVCSRQLLTLRRAGRELSSQILGLFLYIVE